MLTPAPARRRLWAAPLELPLLGTVRRPDVYAAVGLMMALVDGRNHVAEVLRGVHARGGSRTHAVSLLGPYVALVRRPLPAREAPHALHRSA